MKFRSKINEVLFVSEITPDNSYMFDQDLKTGLSIVWNIGETAIFKIDNRTVEVKKNCAIFLTEFHKIEERKFERLNVVQFNREFYCVEDHDSEVGCRGILFFGASDIPKIEIHENRLKQFQLLWDLFVMEMDEMDSLKRPMLEVMLKRFLIVCLRIYKEQNLHYSSDNINVGIVKEYNYLVEKHYKTLTKVSDYAKLLHKSPKTLANLFSKYIDKTPLQIINQRRLLEAKRSLRYTDQSIQEIADDLGYSDIQTFSHSFKKQEGQSPSLFRQESRKPA